MESTRVHTLATMKNNVAIFLSQKHEKRDRSVGVCECDREQIRLAQSILIVPCLRSWLDRIASPVRTSDSDHPFARIDLEAHPGRIANPTAGSS